jgi:hypothetical protein
MKEKEVDEIDEFIAKSDSGIMMIIAVLAKELENKDIISRNEFADALECAIKKDNDVTEEKISITIMETMIDVLKT